MTDYRLRISELQEAFNNCTFENVEPDQIRANLRTYAWLIQWCVDRVNPHEALLRSRLDAMGGYEPVFHGAIFTVDPSLNDGMLHICNSKELHDPRFQIYIALRDGQEAVAEKVGGS